VQVKQSPQHRPAAWLRAARRVATTKKQAIGEVVERASGGTFKYGDVGRMTEGDTAKLRAATELMASTLALNKTVLDTVILVR
jgi:hypothetical protein